MANSIIKMKRGEADTFTFNIKDADGANIDCTGADCTFTVKDTNLATTLFTVADGSFTKADGSVSFPISSSNTSGAAGSYKCDLKLEFSATSIKISDSILFELKEAATS